MGAPPQHARQQTFEGAQPQHARQQNFDGAQPQHAQRQNLEEAQPQDAQQQTSEGGFWGVKSHMCDIGDNHMFILDIHMRQAYKPFVHTYVNFASHMCDIKTTHV